MKPLHIRSALLISLVIGFLRRLSRKLLRPSPRVNPAAVFPVSLYAVPVNPSHAVNSVHLAHAVHLAEIFAEDERSWMDTGIVDDAAYICDNSHIDSFPEDGGPHYNSFLEISLSCSEDRLSNARGNREVRAMLDSALERCFGHGNYILM